MHEVHPKERVDVGSRFVGAFVNNYLTPSRRRIPMLGVNSIDGSVQWLGVPALLSTNGTPWTFIILAPSPAWVTGGTATNPN